jgi:hypothetical protein
MKPVNHALVERLLADETLSYKEIARRASCSDFSVRTIARKLSGDDRPMKTPRVQNETDERELEEPRALTTTVTIIAWGIGALLFVCMLWPWRGRYFDGYPPEGPMQ